MSTIPFVLRRARTAAPPLAVPATARRGSLALYVLRYVLLTVVGPAAAVLGIAALLSD